MKSAKIYYIFLISMVFSVNANTVYKTVKADGTVVYSDVMTEGAVSLSLGKTNSVVIPPLSTVKPAPVIKQKLSPKYEVVIHSPQSEQTIRNNAGDVNVSFEIKPDYVGEFVLLLDNQEVNTNGRTQLTLHNIDRGEHVIEVKLRSNTGKIFASSSKQTFYLHKASVLINAN